MALSDDADVGDAEHDGRAIAFATDANCFLPRATLAWRQPFSFSKSA